MNIKSGRKVRNRAVAVAALALVLAGGIASASQAEEQTLCAGTSYLACENLGYSSFGYAGASGNEYSGASGHDYWAMIPGHNCTNYVAYRLVQAGMADARPWAGNGEAGDWKAGAQSKNLRVDTIPAVGAVAFFPGKNHVAYVERINGDGTIRISEDNYNSNIFAWKDISLDGVEFIHLRDFFEVVSDPTISGDAHVDETLTADAGTWAPAPSSVTYQWNRDGNAISGATDDQYRLTQADIGTSVTVTTTASSDGYADTPSTSAAVDVTAQSFANFVVHLQGTAQVDSTLTASLETMTPDVDVQYRWNRNGVKIPYQVDQTYTLGAEDIGTDISVTITGEKAGYSTTSSTSIAKTVTAEQFDGMAIAYATGTSRIGQVLSATLASDFSGLVLKYQWNRDGVPISGANASTYAPTEQDFAAQLSVTITLTKAGYVPKSVTSARTAAVTGAEVPFDIFILHMSGTPKVNSTLTGSLQTNTSGADVTWQWKRNGSPISLATDNQYTLKQADIGAAITLTVTGTKVGYMTTSQTSSPVTVTAADISMAVPTIGGTAKVDSTVYSNVTVYTPEVYVSYQWKRNGYFINGAQGSGYTLTAADVGASITVTVTGSRAGYVTTSLTSAPVTGTAANLNVFYATITGTARVDSTLTANMVTNTGGVSATYQWKRNGAVVSTAKSYTLVQADIGATMTVTVTGSKAGYYTLSSTASAGVTAAYTFGQRTATITGTVRERYTVTANYTINVSGATVTYQWYRDGVLKSGATGKTFAVGTADIGKKLSVAVTFTKAGYQTATIRSPQTVAVKGYSS